MYWKDTKEKKPMSFRYVLTLDYTCMHFLGPVPFIQWDINLLLLGNTGSCLLGMYIFRF